MDTKEITQLIKQELPRLFKEDAQIRQLVLDISRTAFASKTWTEDRFAESDRRFDRMLAELQRDREEQNRKWEEQNRKWEEQNRKWEEQNHKWEQNQQELRTLREEQDRKWEQNRQDMLQAIKEVNRRIDQTIGALGARWGLHSEASFREGLKGILEESFGVTVQNVVEFDQAGEVFGQPDQIELDILIKNGLLIICELKSSMSRSDMYTFVKKAAFYEKRHQTTADRKVAISPMVEAYAFEIAKQHGVEVYSYPADAVDSG